MQQIETVNTNLAAEHIGAQLEFADPPVLQEAVRWAKRGVKIFPLHHIDDDGLCSCGNPNCKSPGKHPRTPKGLYDATTDLSQIRLWWTTWPRANLGVRTGRESGFFVLDDDPRHGGTQSIKDLEAIHGQLPETPMTITGGGGSHRLYRYPEKTIKNRTNVHPGVDVRGDFGYIVGAYSTHASGANYGWAEGLNIDDIPMADAPAWLVTVITEKPTPCSQPAGNKPKVLPEGSRNDGLFRMACSMRNKGFSEDAIHAALVKENEAHCSPPIDESEIAQIVRSAVKYPSGADPVVTKFDHIRRTPPSDIREEAYYGLAGDVVRAIEPHTESSPIALLLQLLVVFGNVCGRRAHFKVEGDRHFLNEFVALVGDTSKGRKGTSWGQILRLFETLIPEWVSNCIKSGLSSGEGMIWAVRDPIVKTQPVRDKATKQITDYEEVVEDPGVDDKRLLAVESEFASVLQSLMREGNRLSAIIRDAWDRGNLSSLTKSSPAKATNAHISVIGHISRTEVLRYLTATEAANGFANRFMWIFVKRSKLLPEGGRLDTVDFESILRDLRAALALAENTDEIRRNDAARDLWIKEYERLSTPDPGLLGAMTARAEAHVMRLACIYALLDQSQVIEEVHLQAALAVWDYCHESSQYIFGDALGDPVADPILRALRKAPDGVSRTAIRDLFQRNTSSEDIDQALLMLLDLKLARVTSVQTDGRPAEMWHLITETTTETTKAPDKPKDEEEVIPF